MLAIPGLDQAGWLAANPAGVSVCCKAHCRGVRVTGLVVRVYACVCNSGGSIMHLLGGSFEPGLALVLTLSTLSSL